MLVIQTKSPKENKSMKFLFSCVEQLLPFFATGVSYLVAVKLVRFCCKQYTCVFCLRGLIVYDRLYKENNLIPSTRAVIDLAINLTTVVATEADMELTLSALTATAVVESKAKWLNITTLTVLKCKEIVVRPRYF